MAVYMKVLVISASQTFKLCCVRGSDIAVIKIAEGLMFCGMVVIITSHFVNFIMPTPLECQGHFLLA